MDVGQLLSDQVHHNDKRNLNGSKQEKENQLLNRREAANISSTWKNVEAS